MCWAAVGAIAGGASQAGGGLWSAVAANEQAKYDAKVLANRAEQAQMQGQLAREQSQKKKDAIGREIARLKGEGRTAYAAGNVMLGTGTVLSWEETLDEAKRQDQSEIDYDQALTEWGLKNEALGYLDEADLRRKQGQRGIAQAFLMMGGSAMSALGQYKASQPTSSSGTTRTSSLSTPNKG